MKEKYKEIAEEILSLAGVEINGNNPWDIQIHNNEFYRRVITEGELGPGESYMDDWWDAEKVDELICRILKARLDQKIKHKFSILLRLFKARLFKTCNYEKSCFFKSDFCIDSRKLHSGKKIFH